MLKKREKLWPYVLVALVLHLGVLSLLIFTFLPKSNNSYRVNDDTKIIKAHSVSEQQVNKEIQNIKAAGRRERQHKLAVKRKADALKRAKALAAKRKVEAVQKAKLLALKRKAEKALAVKQQAQKKMAKQQQILEQAKAKQKQLEQQLWQQQLAQEQKQLQAARAKQLKGIIDKYKGLIIQAIAQKWIVPDNVSKNLSTQLLIQLAPGGTVINVKLLKSSGNGALDRSAITAVYRASPLPVPNDSAAFSAFRELQLIVRPELRDRQ
tara:strand:- start:66507 stop:67304 length:798 start_codon:yes stop_codon:yes gene_type:complete